MDGNFLVHIRFEEGPDGWLVRQVETTQGGVKHRVRPERPMASAAMLGPAVLALAEDVLSGAGAQRRVVRLEDALLPKGMDIAGLSLLDGPKPQLQFSAGPEAANGLLHPQYGGGFDFTHAAADAALAALKRLVLPTMNVGQSLAMAQASCDRIDRVIAALCTTSVDLRNEVARLSVVSNADRSRTCLRAAQTRATLQFVELPQTQGWRLLSLTAHTGALTHSFMAYNRVMQLAALFPGLAHWLDTSSHARATGSCEAQPYQFSFDQCVICGIRAQMGQRDDGLMAGVVHLQHIAGLPTPLRAHGPWGSVSEGPAIETARTLLHHAESAIETSIGALETYRQRCKAKRAVEVADMAMLRFATSLLERALYRHDAICQSDPRLAEATPRHPVAPPDLASRTRSVFPPALGHV